MLLTVILYALVVMFKAGPVSPWIPMLYGPTTSVLPLLLMFPAMGFGCWGYKGPRQYLLLQTAILNQAFGIGLTIAFRWILKR
jgi:hypothetical protein